jgi:hypothetical protein
MRNRVRETLGINAIAMSVSAVALLSALIALAVWATDVRAESVYTSAATTWECTSGERPDWDDMCMAWRLRMGELGFTKKRANYSRMKVLRFTDPSLQTWGIDNTASDSAVACMICTHGRYPRNYGWRGVMYRKTYGFCELKQQHRKFGRASGGQMRFLHLSSCHSIHWDNRHTWNSAAQGGVHVIMGFHGRMFIGQDFVPDYRHQASDGQVLPGAAWGWLQNMYHAEGFAGRAFEQCPVARGYGDTEDRAFRVLSEKYGENLGDREPKYAYNMWWGGCQPGGQIDDNPEHTIGPLPE